MGEVRESVNPAPTSGGAEVRTPTVSRKSFLSKILEKVRGRSNETSRSEGLSQALDNRLETMQDWINEKLIKGESAKDKASVPNRFKRYDQIDAEFWNTMSHQLGIANKLVIALRLKLGKSA